MPLPDRDSEAHSRLFGPPPNREEINGDKSKKCLNNGRRNKMMNAQSSMEEEGPLNENHHGFPYIDDNHHSEGKGFHCIVILIVIGDDLWHLTMSLISHTSFLCGTQNPICNRT